MPIKSAVWYNICWHSISLSDRSIEKDGDPVRKTFLLIFALFLTLVCACAYAADTEYSLGDGISGKVSLSEDTFIILTPDNLSGHPDTLTELGTTAEALQKDMTDRGVILQAWTKDKDKKTCIEISVVQDEDSARYYDLETASNAVRRQYLKDLLARYRDQGYTVSESEIKLHAKSGHFMVFNYVYRDEEGDHRGVMRKAVRNGYSLIVDYKVYGRRPSRTDRDKGRKIINAIVIDKKDPVPAAASVTQYNIGEETSAVSGSASVPSGADGMLNVTVLPPEQTNDGIFTIEGTAYPGSEVIVVAMSMSGKPEKFSATATKAGNFKAKVKLSNEGIYNIGINMYIDNNKVSDKILPSVTYKKTLLPVQWDTEVPEQIDTDELVISGVTVKNVTVQCLASNGGNTTYDHTVKTNGTGKFKFKIPTTVEADYDITVVFSKKNLNTERRTFTTTRIPSAQATQAKTASKAIHPAYNLLTKKINTYINKTMVYTVYIVRVDKSGDEWLITAALKLSKGNYSQFLNYCTSEDPGLTPGAKVKIYGVCKGTFLTPSEEDSSEGYPDFDLLYIE